MYLRKSIIVDNDANIDNHFRRSVEIVTPKKNFKISIKWLQIKRILYENLGIRKPFEMYEKLCVDDSMFEIHNIYRLYLKEI